MDGYCYGTNNAVEYHSIERNNYSFQLFIMHAPSQQLKANYRNAQDIYW
jgi:hypothetical protein